MTILSKLTLSNKTKAAMLTAPENRVRAKMLDAIETQIAAAEADAAGEPYTIRPSLQGLVGNAQMDEYNAFKAN